MIGVNPGGIIKVSASFSGSRFLIVNVVYDSSTKRKYVSIEALFCHRDMIAFV